ncbi:MAG: sulfotransferase [Planctomycetota bacterium]|jgi:hypothetical protein
MTTRHAPDPGPFTRLTRRARAAPRHAWRAVQAAVRPYARAPVIVLGNQKSGTSAIAALLAARAGRSATIDLRHEEAVPSFHRVHDGRLAFAAFARRNKLDFTRAIIKEPNLTLLAPELRTFFPGARFVFVVRDPRQNIRSILNRLRIPGDLEHLRLEHRREVNETWSLVLDGRWLGLTGDTYIEQLAARWNRLADVYLEQPDRMTLCRYEDFLADKAGCIDDLARGLGLPLRRDIGDQLDRPFQPPGDRAVTPEAFFGAANLRRIETICGPRMRRFGYAASAAPS